MTFSHFSRRGTLIPTGKLQDNLLSYIKVRIKTEPTRRSAEMYKHPILTDISAETQIFPANKNLQNIFSHFIPLNKNVQTTSREKVCFNSK